MGVNPEEATATAFELKDASLGLHPASSSFSSSESDGSALVWLLWQGEARRPFPIGGDDPRAYSEDPAVHTSQVRGEDFHRRSCVCFSSNHSFHLNPRFITKNKCLFSAFASPRQVAFARHAVRVTAHHPQWLSSRDANDDEDEAWKEGYDTNIPEPQPGDAPGQAAALSGDAAAAAEARPLVGKQWSAASDAVMSMLLPGGGGAGGVGYGGDHGGSASQIARLDAAPLRACEPRYQHLRHRIMTSHIADSQQEQQQLMLGSNLATELVLGASLLRWFVAELAQLERSMLSRLIAPGRFSDAALTRCLRSEDGPLTLACQAAVLPPQSAAGATVLTRGELKRYCLGAMRSWACSLCPDLAALLASQRGSESSALLVGGGGASSSQWSRAAAAGDWDALLPDPCGTLNMVGSCWLAFIGGCEWMAAADRAAVALSSTSAADTTMIKHGRSSTRATNSRTSSTAPLVSQECPLVVLANRIGVVSPLGARGSIEGGSNAGVGWIQSRKSGASSLEKGGGAWLVSSATAFENGAIEAGWGHDFWERTDAVVLSKTIDPNQRALGAAATGGAPKVTVDEEKEAENHSLLAVYESGTILEATRNDLASALIAARTADAGAGLLTPRASWEEPLSAVASLLSPSQQHEQSAAVSVTQALTAAVASVWPPAPPLASFSEEQGASSTNAMSDEQDDHSATHLGPLMLEATCSATLTVAALRYRTSRTLMALLLAASADNASSSSDPASSPTAAADAAAARAHVASEVQKCLLTLELASRFYALVLWVGRQPRSSSSSYGGARGESYGSLRMNANGGITSGMTGSGSGLRAVMAAPPGLWLAAGCASGFDPDDDELLSRVAPSVGLEGSSAGSLLLAFAEAAEPALRRRSNLCARAALEATSGAGTSALQAGWLVDGLLAACAPRFPAPLGVGRDAFMVPRKDGTGRTCALLAAWLQKTRLSRALAPVVDLARSVLASASSFGYGETCAHFDSMSGSSFTVESAAKEHATLAALCLLDEAQRQLGTKVEGSSSHVEDVACLTLLQAAPSSLCVDAAASSLVDNKGESGGLDQDNDDDMDLGEEEEDEARNLESAYSAQLRDLANMSQEELVRQWQAKNLTSAQTLDGGALSVALQARTSLVALWAADAPSCLRCVVDLVRNAGRGRSSLPALWPQLLGWPRAQRAVLSYARRVFLDASAKLFLKTSTSSSTTMPSSSSSSVVKSADRDAIAARAVSSGRGSSEARALSLVRAAMQAGCSENGASASSLRRSSSQGMSASSSLAPLGSLAFSLLLRLGAWTDAFRAIIATTKNPHNSSSSSAYLLSAASRRAHMEQLTLSLCESGRLDALVSLPFDSQILEGRNASHSSTIEEEEEVNLLRVVDDFLTKESIVCQALSSSDNSDEAGESAASGLGLSLDAPLSTIKSGSGGHVVLDALAWHRARFSFSVSRGHWRSAAEGLYQLVQRISAQAPHRTSLLAHALRLCLSALKLAPKDRRFLTVRSVHLQPSDSNSMNGNGQEPAAGLELVTMRSLKLEVAITEARHTLQEANATIAQSHTIFSDDWSQDTYALAAASGGSRDCVAATEVALALAAKGYFSEACSLACALVAWDLSPVGVSVSGGGNHKRRAIEALMADGSPMVTAEKEMGRAGILAGASSSVSSAPPPSSVGSDQHLGRRLLEDIVARLATTCVALQHWAQPDSKELDHDDGEDAQQPSWDESRRPLLHVASEQSWTQGVRSNDWSGAAILPAHADYLHGAASSCVHPHDVATAAAAAERCWGARHAKSGWQLLQRLLKALDGPRWNFALTKAAAEAAMVAGSGRPGTLPLWLQSRFIGDERANPKGLPTAAHRAAGNRRSPAPAAVGETGDGSALGGGADSAALLRSYLKAGLLNDALDLATALVVGATKAAPRDPNKNGAPSSGVVMQVTASDATAHLHRTSLSSRQPLSAPGNGGWNEEAEILLPERGDAVWLPYSTFDQVIEVAWGLLEQHHAVASASFPGLETKVKEFEACLKAHFRKLITQEAFLGSARTIALGNAH